MNTYKYRIPISIEEEIWYTPIDISMTPHDKHIFNYCIKNNQLEELGDLLEYLRTTYISYKYMYPLLLDDHLITDIDPDYTYTFSGRSSIHDFSNDDISLKIKTLDILFDEFNDLANTGDLPYDLISLMEESASTILECGFKLGMDSPYDYEYNQIQ